MRGIIISLIMCVGLYAQLGRTGSLLEIPTADFPEAYIPQIHVTNSFSLALNSNDDHFFDMDYLHMNVYFFDKFAAGFNFFTTREIGMDFIYRFFSSPGFPSIAFGIRNITYTKFISPAGGNPPEGGFADENYTGKKRRNPENFSFFIVSSYNIAKKYGIHLGLGRGEFVGYGPHSKYLNTDIFTDISNDLAIGLFMGFEFKYSNPLNFILEIDGRDLNLGLKGHYMLIDYFFEIAKLELLIWGAKDLYPRIGAGIGIRLR